MAQQTFTQKSVELCENKRCMLMYIGLNYFIKQLSHVIHVILLQILAVLCWSLWTLCTNGQNLNIA